MDDAIQLGLRIFFLFMAIITVVTALNLAVVFEHEYIQSSGGPVLSIFAGWTGNLILFIMFFSLFLMLLWKIIAPSTKASLKRKFNRW
jgi:hypothetical protein